MAITNPLFLPEFREELASLLPTNDLARCVQVSKSWCTSFEPFIWRTVEVRSSQPGLEPLLKHRGSIQHLTYRGTIPSKYCSIQYPALKTLEFTAIAYSALEGFKILRILPNNPSLTRLKLQGDTPNISFEFSIPPSLSNLTSLNLTGIAIQPQVMSEFLKVLQQLETLELHNCSLTEGWQNKENLDNPPKGQWKLKNLVLAARFGMTSRQQLAWIIQLDQLRRLSWVIRADFEYFPIEDFTRCLPYLTELEDIHLGDSRASDRQLSLIIQGIQRVIGLAVTRAELDVRSKEALRPHFPWIRKLDISNSSGYVSKFVLEVLRSCPQLENLKTDKIHAGDCVDGTPWACDTSLKTLEVCFEVSQWERAEQQEVVMSKLARLKNLEVLDVSDRESLENVLTVEFRLNRGLAQLSALTRLTTLTITRTIQQSTQDDVEWMIKHWRSLSEVNGKLHVGDLVESRLLAEKLGNAGVTNMRT
jgi:hypothetical protein